MIDIPVQRCSSFGSPWPLRSSRQFLRKGTWSQLDNLHSGDQIQTVFFFSFFGGNVPYPSKGRMYNARVGVFRGRMFGGKCVTDHHSLSDTFRRMFTQETYIPLNIFLQTSSLKKRLPGHYTFYLLNGTKQNKNDRVVHVGLLLSLRKNSNYHTSLDRKISACRIFDCRHLTVMLSSWFPSLVKIW